jgi:tartrate-resistant acid phosphatase type 5
VRELDTSAVIEMMKRPNAFLFNLLNIFTQMGIIGEKLDIDFVISTGDNFYDDGLKGVDDPAFDESFTKIYTAPSLQKQWYSGKITPPKTIKQQQKEEKKVTCFLFALLCVAVLGNHDYRGDVLAQLSPTLRKLDSRWLCLRSFILNAGNNGTPLFSFIHLKTIFNPKSFFLAEIVEFFFVDTTPFVDKYFKEPKDDVYDWRGILPRKQYLSNILRVVYSIIASLPFHSL